MPLGEAAMHGVTGELLRIIEPHTEADPAAILLSFLAGVGIAVGNGPHAAAEGDQHPGRLFVGIVGDTSKGRKGTSWSRIRDVLNLSFDDYSDRMVGGLSSGEGLIWQVRDPIVKLRAPKNSFEREDVNDDGHYAEIDDEGISDKRLLVVEGELAGALRVLRREGNTLSAVLRNFWDRGDVQSLTKSAVAKTTGAHIGIVGHITIDELRKELAATESSNGFANRFCWVCASRSKLLPDGGKLNPADLVPMAAELERVAVWTRQPRLLTRDAAAAALWRQVYGELSNGLPGLLGAVTSRAEAQVLRLSVIYATLDRSPVITEQHLSAALEVWRYCLDSAAWIFGDRSGNPIVDQILKALENRRILSRTEIRDLLGRHVRAEQIEDAIATLTAAGRVECSKETTGGRPTELVKLRAGDESDISEESPPTMLSESTFVDSTQPAAREESDQSDQRGAA